ncbi:uncharacterized protein PFL1_05936 [Pseudozyma flocculosa PF-1]|uniref:Uncharacterized protein n=1 Tax=Pseudozyma flocculosa PF-1 TaxID=1277687 RepID=A0A061H3X6_9BASI|nr:uncharacterized protein PFL1_05936 [Pseudozyma flocculosa PF-1]EPQ26615.1 hypothetical protein PFL1_05936 [Pseudozyma flocculosa PF-1]
MRATTSSSSPALVYALVVAFLLSSTLLDTSSALAYMLSASLARAASSELVHDTPLDPPLIQDALSRSGAKGAEPLRPVAATTTTTTTTAAGAVGSDSFRLPPPIRHVRPLRSAGASPLSSPRFASPASPAQSDRASSVEMSVYHSAASTPRSDDVGERQRTLRQPLLASPRSEEGQRSDRFRALSFAMPESPQKQVQSPAASGGTSEVIPSQRAAYAQSDGSPPTTAAASSQRQQPNGQVDTTATTTAEDGTKTTAADRGDDAAATTTAATTADKTDSGWMGLGVPRKAAIGAYASLTASGAGALALTYQAESIVQKYKESRIKEHDARKKCRDQKKNAPAAADQAGGVKRRGLNEKALAWLLMLPAPPPLGISAGTTRREDYGKAAAATEGLFAAGLGVGSVVYSIKAADRLYDISLCGEKDE